MQFAKIIENTLIEPQDAEFNGIPNWRTNLPAIRRKGYMPVEGEAEPQEGYTATPATWHVVEQSTTRVEPRPQVVEDFEEDPETHEQKKTGEHTEMRDTEIQVDTSYIQIDTWDYAELPTPPEPVLPDTTERDTAEKQIVGLILQLAAAHDAVEDIALMQDITIPNLEALAASKGVTTDSSEWLALIAAITPLKWQLEAIEDTTWARCWQGLKSRFPQWMQELLNTPAVTE